MKERTVAIIQARMGSTRFPGKMLARLGEYPVLEWVLRRTKQAHELDGVVLATSSLACDQALVDLAKKCDVEFFCGDEDDVLGRFVGASEFSHTQRVVRVCADNPFVDPCEINRLILFFGSDGKYDYACNHLDRLGNRYADGFGAEILNVELLKQIENKATDKKYREHVTSYLWEHSDEYRLAAVQAPVELAYPNLSFDIDIPADLVRLGKLVAAGVGIETSASKIVEIALLQQVFLRLS